MNSKYIYRIMLSKCPNTKRNKHFLKRYIRFIVACLEKNKTLPKDTYTENHHIIPKGKQFWPEYSDLRTNRWNSATLTARQHVIAHWILAKALEHGMWTALWSMVNGKGHHYRPKGERYFNSKLVAIAKEENAIAHSSRMKLYHETNPSTRDMAGENNPFYGKHHSDETKARLSKINTGKVVPQEIRDKISSSLMGREVGEETRKIISESQKGERNSFYGKTHTEETRLKISEKNRGREPWIKGKSHSEETKKLMSEKNKGKCKNKDVTCPHCNKSGKSSGMGKWHFDNCRFKPATSPV